LERVQKKKWTSVGLQTLYRFVTDDDVNRIREADCKAFPVSAEDPIRLYQPYYGQSDPIAALAMLHRKLLTRFCAPKRRLLEHSKGVTEISGAELRYLNREVQMVLN
jgi:hypothetical protein